MTALVVTLALLGACAAMQSAGTLGVQSGDELSARSPTGWEMAMTPMFAVLPFLVIWGLIAFRAWLNERRTRLG